MNEELANLGLRELRSLLRERKISAAEMVEFFRARARADERLNAFLRVDDDAPRFCRRCGQSGCWRSHRAQGYFLCTRRQDDMWVKNFGKFYFPVRFSGCRKMQSGGNDHRRADEHG